MFAGLAIAIVAIAGVSVFYMRHDFLVPKASTRVSQSESAPPVDPPPTGLQDRDGQFVLLLTSQGLQMPGGREGAISDAHRVCSRLSRGESEQQIIQDIFQGSPGMSIATATSFADIAIGAYCPQG